MKKGSHYRRNQSSSSLFEHAQTLEALSKQGNPLEFISEMIDFEMFRPFFCGMREIREIRVIRENREN